MPNLSHQLAITSAIHVLCIRLCCLLVYIDVSSEKDWNIFTDGYKMWLYIAMVQ